MIPVPNIRLMSRALESLGQGIVSGSSFAAPYELP